MRTLLDIFIKGFVLGAILAGLWAFTAPARAEEAVELPTHHNIYISKPSADSPWLFCADEYVAADGTIMIQRTFHDFDGGAYDIITSMKQSVAYGIIVSVLPALDYNCHNPDGTVGT